MTFTAGLLLISTAVGIFLTLLLGLSKRAESRILAAFTALLMAISILQLTVALKSALMLYLPFVVFPAIFLHGLVIDAYTRKLLGRLFYGSAKVMLFSLPAFTAFCAQIVMFALFPQFRNIDAVYHQQGLVKIYTTVLFISAMVYNLGFIGLSARMLLSAQLRVKNKTLSTPSGRYGWLKLFLLFNALLWVAGGTNVLYNLLADQPAPVNPVMAVLFSGGNYLILVFLIKRPAIFALSGNALTDNQKGKYAKIQILDADTRQQYVQRIQQYLQSEEAFLDEAFSLNQFGEQLGIAPHLVSMVINTELQQNFYTLVNSYRVQKAKQLLLAETRPNMLEIAYASGFQSKSAFNKVFKQFTGLTPSDFKKP